MTDPDSEILAAMLEDEDSDTLRIDLTYSGSSYHYSFGPQDVEISMRFTDQKGGTWKYQGREREFQVISSEVVDEQRQYELSDGKLTFKGVVDADGTFHGKVGPLTDGEDADAFQ